MALCHKLHKLLKHVKAWPILRSETPAKITTSASTRDVLLILATTKNVSRNILSSFNLLRVNNCSHVSVNVIIRIDN